MLYKTMILSHTCCLAQISVVRSVCVHWMFLLDQLDTELIWFVYHSPEKYLWKLWHSIAIRCVLFLEPFSHGRAFHQNSADFVMNSAAEYEDWGGYVEMLWKGKKKELVAHFPRWMCLPNYIHKSARKSGLFLVGCIWGVPIFDTPALVFPNFEFLFPQDWMVEFRIVR